MNVARSRTLARRRIASRRADLAALASTDTLTEIDLRMMRRALRLAAGAAAVGEVPIAAVVWRRTGDGIEIVAEAANDREATG
ncbi:MAG: hypothetical protein ACYTE2_03270, partial [Planctomycetota bacterium]